MDGLSLERQPSGERKKTYAFWETQPVAQFNDSKRTNGSAEACSPRCAEPLPASSDVQVVKHPKVRMQDGPIDAPKTVADVRQEPYNLPERYASLTALHRACPLARVSTMALQDWLIHLSP